MHEFSFHRDEVIAMQTISAKRVLGGSGLEVSAIGLGCMSFSGVYGASDDDSRSSARSRIRSEATLLRRASFASRSIPVAIRALA